MLRIPSLPPLPVRQLSMPTRRPFRIRTLGSVRKQPLHITAGTYHEDAMLTVVRSGTGLYHSRGSVERVGPGTIGLVLPSTDPGLLMADPDDPYDHCYCRFAGREALSMARAAVIARGGRRFFEDSRWVEVSGIVEGMLSRWRQAAPTGDAWMDQAECELARILSLLVVPVQTGRMRLSGDEIRRYLNEHLAEPLDLGRMAKHFHMSRSQFSRRAHQLLGDRLSAVSTRLKIDFSMALLAASTLELGVAEIARRVGYEDPLYFSKVFRRRVGTSPSHYRRKLAQVHNVQRETARGRGGRA
jgi:AraC-like DNA-binding protein